ncbi:MAG: hypothetical protein LBG05_06100 [Treponema sp.]|jgi:hypothetical protein|nr:hypothetical protein [Treponema sp.]
MGLKDISKKWTMMMRDWDSALNQFAIAYGEDRIPLPPPMIFRLPKICYKLQRRLPLRGLFFNSNYSLFAFVGVRLPPTAIPHPIA